MLSAVLAGLFLACVGIQLAYVFYFFSVFPINSDRHADYEACTRTLKGKELPADFANDKPVSIIICARNEAANLKKNLPAVLAQRYANPERQPMFEVIVVNDGSSDDTESVLSDLYSQYPLLRVVNVPQDSVKLFPGKKNALAHGVSIASHDIIALTDADCKPTSEYWLFGMIDRFYVCGEHAQIVCGYGKYHISPGMLNSFTRWETLHTFLQYASYNRRGLPYMAVGRNLVCTKSMMEHASANPIWSHLPSGDDDLLIALTHNLRERRDGIIDYRNIGTVISPQAFTVSEAKQTWADWVRQKQRHLSTGKYYRPLIKVLLAGYALSHGLMWMLFISAVCTSWWMAVVIAMVVRCLVYWYVWAGAAKTLQEPGLTSKLPIFDLGWAIYNAFFAPYILWKTKQRWT